LRKHIKATGHEHPNIESVIALNKDEDIQQPKEKNHGGVDSMPIGILTLTKRHGKVGNEY